MDLLRPAKKGQLTNYCLFIASRYFISSDDYSNVERGCKRFLGNTSKFFYNPIPLTEQTREWFDHLQTLFIYSSKDMKFEEDERILKREYVKVKPYDLLFDQVKQIEEWTSKKCEEIVFDSEKDDWSYGGKSTFDSKILNKNQLIFIIEDTEGNRFGGYIDATIDKIGWIEDSKSFIFSIESKGRLNSMKKFNIRKPEFAFCLYKKSYERLFEIGLEDIHIFKKGSRYGKHYCEQNSFNYERNQNTLCGKEYFGIKRFTVIQMK